MSKRSPRKEKVCPSMSKLGPGMSNLGQDTDMLVSGTYRLDLKMEKFETAIGNLGPGG